jgi:signal transduction histidine kinase/CheY-like chemotaxis protein
MVSSLAKLNEVTTGLPERITADDSAKWPRSSILEVESLINNFRTTSQKLADNIQQLTIANEELVKAKIEADAANRAKSQFIANVSHDLRTPLNGILGYAQILRHDRELDERHAGALDVIEHSGNHLLNLINDILDVSKIEAGKMRLTYSTFSLRDLLEDLTSLTEMQARERGIRFVVSLDPRLPEHAYGDELRIRQILSNLLNNAVKFTPAGSVTLEAHRSGDDVLFSVRDTGIGIPRDEISEIFSPFKQIDKHVHAEEGTGLGLAIVERLVNMMDGSLNVESVVGEGSTFAVRLALPEAEGAAIRRGNRRTVRGYVGEERSILVIDDKWENRSVLTNMLEPLGFRMLEAPDGHEGIEEALREAPDLILMDLVMPVMDGFDAIKVIRNSSPLSSRPVIAISASVADPVRQECIRLGFDDFLAKPFQENDLLDMLSSYLGLEWIYESREGRDVADTGPAGEWEASLPGTSTLHELQNHVKRGDIKGIFETVDHLRREDRCYGEFCDRVVDLAKGFQIEKLAGYVAQVLRNSEK